jgi:hypothetical protein
VTRADYTFGNSVFRPTGFPVAVELTGSVHYPTGLAGGPFPLLVLLHGRHVTCYVPPSSGGSLNWPCGPGEQPIPSHRGYDYMGQALASHGYIVVSISANGINAYDQYVLDLGMQARAELIQKHLDIWRAYTTTGGPPFGTTFVGKVNLQRVGVMGHSRGGEGAVQHYLLNQSKGAPYGVRAVLPLAPVDFSRRVINNVPLAVLLPYCDGDVSDLQGIHFFDDARYNVPGDRAAKHTILVMGANHNYYNAVWTPTIFPAGAIDDWQYADPSGTDPHCGSRPGNQRLTPAQQRGTGLAYTAAFFRTYVGGEPGFGAYLTGDVLPPPSAQTNQIHVSFHAPDDPARRRDVNRLLTAANLTTNTLGGAASQSGFTPYSLCGGDAPQPQHCLPGQSTARQPHTTPSYLSAKRGLSQLQGGWSSTAAVYANELPVGARDVSGYRAIQFRASVSFADARNPSGTAQDFSVVLVDGAQRAASVPVGTRSRALFYPPGLVSAVPKVVLNTVRLPLASFAGVDLHDIRSVQFRFDQRPSGALLVSDLAFASVAP